MPAPSVVDEPGEDDDLYALTPRAKRAVVAKRRAAAKSDVSAQDNTGPEPTRANDFGFLEEEQDLKRPSF